MTHYKLFPQHTPAGRLDIGTCATCGKRMYSTAKVARMAKRRIGDSGLHVYRCGGYFHLGHVPENITRGYTSKAEVYDR